MHNNQCSLNKRFNIQINIKCFVLKEYWESFNQRKKIVVEWGGGSGIFFQNDFSKGEPEQFRVRYILSYINTDR